MLDNEIALPVDDRLAVLATALGRAQRPGLVVGDEAEVE